MPELPQNFHTGLFEFIMRRFEYREIYFEYSGLNIIWYSLELLKELINVKV